MNVNVSAIDFIGYLLNGTLETSLCRICLKPFGEVCENIFTQFWLEKKTLSVADILKKMCQAEFSANDNYNVCYDCIVEAFTAYNFYLKYQSTTKLLDDYTNELEECISKISSNCGYIKNYQQVCLELKKRNFGKSHLDYDIQNFLGKTFEMSHENSDMEIVLADVELKLKQAKKVDLIFVDMDYDSDMEQDDPHRALLQRRKSRLQRRKVGKKDIVKKKRNKSIYNLHLTTKKPKKQCEICEAKYNSFYPLFKHCSKKHDLSYCDICSEFYKKSDVHSHLEMHGDACCCDTCKIIFHTRDNLRQHLEFHKLLYVCEICGHVATNHHSHKAHHYIKHGNKNRERICKFCGKKYFNPIQYNVHVARHKVLLENADKKVLNGKEQLEELAKHAPNKKPRLVCSECGADYVDHRALKMHMMRFHTGERPFVCEDCGRGFVSRNLLNTHIDKMHRLPRHRCPLCENAFSVRTAVSDHIRKVHLRGRKRHPREKGVQQEVTWDTTPVPFEKLRIEIQYGILEKVRAGELTLPAEMMTDTMKKLLKEKQLPE